MVKFIPPPGHHCHVSTGIHDGLTFGTGKLDEHGFWDRPCCDCARAHEQQFPEDGPCWPFTDAQLVKMALKKAEKGVGTG